jgi:hypothetical protein
MCSQHAVCIFTLLQRRAQRTCRYSRLQRRFKMTTVVHTCTCVIFLPFCSENGYVAPGHGVVELQAQRCLSTLASMEPGPCRRSMPRKLGSGDPSLRDSCSAYARGAQLDCCYECSAVPLSKTAFRVIIQALDLEICAGEQMQTKLPVPDLKRLWVLTQDAAAFAVL